MLFCFELELYTVISDCISYRPTQCGKSGYIADWQLHVTLIKMGIKYNNNYYLCRNNYKLQFVWE